MIKMEEKKIMSKEERLLKAIFGDNWEDMKKEMDEFFEKKRVNILEIEKAIDLPMQMARLPKKEMADSIRFGFTAKADDEAKKVFKDIVDDLFAIFHNTEDNRFGMHVSRVPSGVMKYDLMWQHYPEKNDYELTYDCVGTYDTEKKANKAMDRMKAGEGEEYFVVGYDPDEYWEILNDKGERVIDILFPTKNRAMAFVIAETKPESYLAYKAHRDKVISKA